MQLAIDSYCYHRFFGEWYDGLQTDPGRRMDVWDCLDCAQTLQVQGVSLESCFVDFAAPGVPVGQGLVEALLRLQRAS